MKVKIFALGLSLLWSVAFVSGQAKPAALTNANIIKLVKGGLDNDLVLTKIESSTCKFDVSDDGLLALKKAGVPTAVIKAMISKMDEVKPAAPDVPKPTAPAAKPAASTEPETLNTVYFYNKASSKLQILEKAKADRSTKMKGLSSQLVFQLEGEKSSCRIPASDNISFMIGLSEALGDPSGAFTLYKAEVKGGKRNALWMKMGTFTGKASSGDNVITYEVRKTGKAFEIIPPKLEKGEYYFVAMGTSLKYGGQAYDAFAFGVD